VLPHCLLKKERYQLEKRVSYLEDKVRLLQQDESLSLKPRSQEVKLEGNLYEYRLLFDAGIISSTYYFVCNS
jgi:hypothetical protein